MARTHIQFVQEIEERNKNSKFKIKIAKGSFYKTLDTDMVFECCNGHQNFTTKPRYIIHKNSGCPLCSSAKISVSNRKESEVLLTQLSQINNIRLLPNQQYINTATKMKFVCDKGHKIEMTPKSVLAGHSCNICANINRRNTLLGVDNLSLVEQLQLEIDLLIKDCPINVVLMPINQPYEKYYYVNMLKQTKDTKQTIFLFEDEWLDNRELILSKLRHYSKTNDTCKKIHARKCTIKLITNNDKKELLNTHHVQGNDNAPISLGAYFEDELVAVMTFCSPRVSVGAKRQTPNTWELSRFCTNTNYRIPGIASKLLKYFQTNFIWSEIYSFADKRWSVGNLYYQLGFTLVADNLPSYFYVVDGKRKHRWNYRKDVLKTKLDNYDPNLTEYQNMTNNGYWRVWDCGTLKFSMTNSLLE